MSLLKALGEVVTFLTTPFNDYECVALTNIHAIIISGLAVCAQTRTLYPSKLRIPNTNRLAIKSSKQLEGILEAEFGAEGKGLHEKLNSVQASGHPLPEVGGLCGWTLRRADAPAQLDRRPIHILTKHAGPRPQDPLPGLGAQQADPRPHVRSVFVCLTSLLLLALLIEVSTNQQSDPPFTTHHQSTATTGSTTGSASSTPTRRPRRSSRLSSAPGGRGRRNVPSCD